MPEQALSQNQHTKVIKGILPQVQKDRKPGRATAEGDIFHPQTCEFC